MIRWTQERIDEITAAWHEDPNKRRIAAKLGYTLGQVSRACMSFNLHPPLGKHKQWHLKSGHPAAIEGRSRFKAKPTKDGFPIFKDGLDSVKIGRWIEKGPWAGMRVYTLTLEERATCPRTCKQWLTCMGNNMPFSARQGAGAYLEMKIRREIAMLSGRHRNGFVVRLHILGDFYSVDYVRLWRRMLDEHKALHVFGYTAWQPHTRIGCEIAALRDERWDRFAVRTSGAVDGPRTLVIESGDAPAGAIICPAQTGKTQSCSSCALCWSATIKDRPIAFLQH